MVLVLKKKRLQSGFRATTQRHPTLVLQYTPTVPHRDADPTHSPELEPDSELSLSANPIGVGKSYKVPLVQCPH